MVKPSNRALEQLRRQLAPTSDSTNLIELTGLPATGKTTLAQMLADDHYAPLALHVADVFREFIPRRRIFLFSVGLVNLLLIAVIAASVLSTHFWSWSQRKRRAIKVARGLFALVFIRRCASMQFVIDEGPVSWLCAVPWSSYRTATCILTPLLAIFYRINKVVLVEVTTGELLRLDRARRRGAKAAPGSQVRAGAVVFKAPSQPRQAMMARTRRTLKVLGGNGIMVLNEAKRGETGTQC